MKPDTVAVPLCPECTQATKLSVTQLSRRAPWLGMSFLTLALPQAFVPEVTQLLSSRAVRKPGQG